MNWFAFGACLGLVATDARAQSLTTGPVTVESHQDSPRRARSVRVQRPALHVEKKSDYAELDRGSSFEEGADLNALEIRIRDLSSKVEELNDLLRQKRSGAAATHFALRPARAKLLHPKEPPRGPRTHGEAIEELVRNRTRAISASFDDGARRTQLAFDPEPDERERLLQPIYRWVDAQKTEADHFRAELMAFVYLSLLEARAKVDATEPLPAMHRVLREFGVDRASLTGHLRERFLGDDAMDGRDLPVVLRAVARTYPDLQSVRDLLLWVASGIGSDLRESWQKKASFAYHAESESQFEAAAENAVLDDGDVLKLQIDLQRMSVEAKALHAEGATSHATTIEWQGRLLRAERELDRLLRAADGEREAVTTLARRLPIAQKKIEIAEPAVDSSAIERPEDELASDDLTTQH